MFGLCSKYNSFPQERELEIAGDSHESVKSQRTWKTISGLEKTCSVCRPRVACIKMRSGCLSKTARVGGVVNYEKKGGCGGGRDYSQGRFQTEPRECRGAGGITSHIHPQLEVVLVR